MMTSLGSNFLFMVPSPERVRFAPTCLGDQQYHPVLSAGPASPIDAMSPLKGFFYCRENEKEKQVGEERLG
jgi:hypothetical protein